MKKLTHLLTLITSMVVLAFVINSCETAQAEKGKETASSGKKKILFIAGQPSHSNGEHEFRAGCMLLADALNESGLNVEAKVHFYGWPEDESIFDRVDACVIYADAGGRFGDKYEFLNKKVKEDGMGIMFMHYGVHPSPQVGKKYFKNWIGAYMLDNFSVNPHWIADLKAVATEDVSRGLEKPFTAYDEFYFNMKTPTKEEDGNYRPLALATPTPQKIVRYINMWNKYGEDCFGKEQALMWCRDPKASEGGRGVGFVGGHYHRNWAIDDFRKLVLNSIVWAARMEVPEGGVVSKSIDQAMLNANLDRPTKKPVELPTDALLQQKPMKQPQLGDKEKRNKGKKTKKAKKVAITTPIATQTNDKPRILARSETLSAGGKKSQQLEANVEELEVVTLQADALGSNDCDWVSWVDIAFIDSKGGKTAVTEEHISSASTGWGKVETNKNAEGNKISIDGKAHELGIGVHAPSSIVLKVPKNAVKLIALGGIDDGGAIRGGKPSASKVQLSIINDNGEWAPAKEPAIVELEHFAIPEDSNLEVTLWASSPMLYNPTNMDIDSEGRIWVAEAVNYRRQNLRSKGDRIVVLQDTTGDGKADKSHTFVQDPSIKAPLGVSVFDNKIVVPMPPNLLVFTDVDRNLKFDPKVDKKEVLMSGFNALQHDHSLHSVTHGPDGKWYFNNGNCGAIFTDKSGKTFNMNGVYKGGGGTWFANNNLGGKKSDDGFLWTSGFSVRVNPDGTNAEITGHGYRNSYEHSINSLGDIFQNDNDDFGSCRSSYILEYGNAGWHTRDGTQSWRSVQRPGQPVAEAHWRQADPGTFDAGDVYGHGSPTGNVYYENGALGKEWEGSFLACEAARNVVFGYKPTAQKATYSMEPFDFITSNVAKEYVGGDQTKTRIGEITADTSKTILFRPSDVAVGPDGAIYITDWYDGRVGGHSTIDDSCSGAIYRIAPKGFKSVIPKIDLATTAGQIEALKSPAVNVRHSGFTRLRDAGEKSFDAVVALLDNPNKYIAARAVWLLPHLGEKGMAKCIELLDSDNTDMKLVAYRALRRTEAGILAHAKKLASDPSDAVRRDVALSLRNHTAEETKDIFVELAKHVDITDKNSVEAIGLGAENKENAIWSAIKASQEKQDPEQWTDSFAKLTWRLWPSAAVADLTKRAMSSKVSGDQQKLATESLAFIDDKSATEAMFTLADDKSPVKADAAYWLLKRGTGSWAKFGIKDQLKQRGIYDADKIVVNEMKLPEPPKESKLPPVAEILKLKGDAEKGKLAMMRCVQCHAVNGTGPNYGPMLQGWGTTQSREAIITSIRNPSGDIAHGYSGKEIITKDGKTVHGLVTEGDPAIVTSMGGITQLIPKKQIKSMKNMKNSLMLSPDQLGLSAQDIADIATYMQQWK